jgi:ribosomal protein L32
MSNCKFEKDGKCTQKRLSHNLCPYLLYSDIRNHQVDCLWYEINTKKVNK